MSEDRDGEIRYERKFWVEQLDEHQVRTLIRLHPSLFVQAYPPRAVNNLYLDSPDLASYLDNVSGVPNRRKIRVRWYGNLFGWIEQPTLEFKLKRGLVGTKERYPLAPFTLDGYFSNPHFCQFLQEADLPPRVKLELKELGAVLLNRYDRWYFASRDGRFRITIDTHLAFYRVSPLHSRFAHRQMDYRHLVVELKYAPQHAAEAPRVAGFFPFRVTRSSKYVQGIERVFG